MRPVSLPFRPATLSRAAPQGTRDVLPPEWAWREHLRTRLAGVFAAWGYRGVEVPALEFAEGGHPQNAQAFKLIDTGGEVLALRSEFTTAVGRLVRARFPEGPFPLRLQYGGRLWLRTLTSELGRLREFGQVGVELLGVATPQADAELLRLGTRALAAVGVQAVMEVGYPGFVDAVLEDAGLPAAARDALHDAIDRKSGADVDLLAAAHGLKPEVTATLHTLTDLYGGPEVLMQAAALARGERARAAVAHLEAVAALSSPAPGEPGLLFDLGASRRYGYYTGITFRAYAEGLNQPVLGGGRYDLGGLPGAGFAIGLERLTEVTAAGLPPEPEVVLALDAAGADLARAAGLVAELAWTDDRGALLAYCRSRGIRRWAQGDTLTEVTA